MHAFWAELSALRWCPALPDAPAAGLPWRPPSSASNRADGGGAGAAGGEAGGVAPLAAPRDVRPAGDMWLASASLHVLDGECR